jgi:hypothetical protein
VTTVEQGGFGADTAAPAACQIIKTWYDLGDKPCTASSDKAGTIE